MNVAEPVKRPDIPVRLRGNKCSENGQMRHPRRILPNRALNKQGSKCSVLKLPSQRKEGRVFRPRRLMK